MKAQELTLLKELVRMGFDHELSSRCDDFDMDLLADFNAVEIAELSSEFCQYNGDPENYEEDQFIRVGMISAGRFLFSKLMQRVEAN